MTGSFLDVHSARAADPCIEDFADVASLVGRGWTIVNDSQPLGPTTWHQGSEKFFDAYEGNPNSFAAAAASATTGWPSLVSVWLITPEILFGPNEYSAKRFDFYARAVAGMANRLVVRQCQITAVEDCGAPQGGLGGFTTTLLDINPDVLVDGFPWVWTGYYVTPADGLLVAGYGRIAFHYYLSSQPDGSHGSYIGIDSAGMIGATYCPFAEIVFRSGFD